MNWVTTSTRLYAALLQLYPKRFREAYGEELLQVFRDCARDGHRSGGVWGVVRVWMGVLPDLFTTAAEQHAEEDATVSRKILGGTLSGFLVGVLSGAGLIGGALWILVGAVSFLRPPGVPGGLYRDVQDLLPLYFSGVQLVSLGLIAVFLLPGRQWSMPYRLLLLVAAGGGQVTAMGWQFFGDTADWMVLMGGILIQIAGIALAGLGLLQQVRSRTWGALLLTLAAAMLLFNFEDWRTLFLALSGALAMGLMVLMFRSAPGPNPRTPALG